MENHSHPKACPPRKRILEPARDQEGRRNDIVTPSKKGPDHRHPGKRKRTRPSWAKGKGGQEAD